MSVYRRLSPIECVYLGGAPSYPPFAIQLWLEASTLPARSALEKALAAAAAVNPGARLRVEGKSWVDTGATPRIREMPASQSPSLAHPLFHEPFDFGRVPLEVVAWEGQGLVFRCSHALMDARGLYFFAEEVFRALRGEEPLGTSFHQCERDYLLALRHPRPRPWPREDCISPLGKLPGRDPARFVWKRVSLKGDFPAAGPRLAFALARLSLQEGSKARLMVPVDLRQLDPGVRTTMNFSNPLFFDLAPGTSWTEFYRLALEAFARHDERATEPLDALFPWLPRGLMGWVHRSMHSRQVRRGKYMLTAAASHVGKLSLARLTAPGFRPHNLFLLPFDAPGAGLTLVSLQHENGLELAASAPGGPGVEAALEKALARIRAALEAPLEAVLESDEHGPEVEYVPNWGERVSLDAGESVLSLVAEAAREFPELQAVDGLAYRELLALAAGFEKELRARGVRPGEKVALLSGRSAESVAALLGILACGAAFVPLDDAWPADRIRFVLEDSGTACLITDDRFAELHPNPVFLAAVKPAVEALSVPVVKPEALAYVLYTSGSTGRPKGVMVGQGSFLNYVQWAGTTYHEGIEADRLVFPFFTSLAFDLTLTSLFVPLAYGGGVKVFSQAEPLHAAAAILADPSLTAIKLTPSHLRIFRELGLGKSALELFVVGGEALPSALAAEVTAQTGGRAKIWNEYGPTEATVGCAAHLFDPSRDRQAVPIGKPIANAEILLLDDTACLVPPGVVGEVYISGACLALGYLSRPEEEARFSPHPYRAGEGHRVYRTGDKAFLDPEGLLHYRGRLDEQVKVLGHRVELGEVEAAIELTGLCREAAVLHEGGRLTAFVSWRGEAAAERLRLALGELLPRALVPSRIVELASLPLTVNGKVDKSRLPRALPGQAGGADSGSGLIGLEGSLAAIAAELLGLPAGSVPLHRSLLELGFDSLQMALLLSRAAAAHLGEEGRGLLFAELADFLREPTILSLAEHLRGLGAR